MKKHEGKKIPQAFKFGPFPSSIQAGFDLLTPYPIQFVQVPLKQLFEVQRVFNYLGAPMEAADVERELKSKNSTTTRLLIQSLEIALAEQQIMFQQWVNSPIFKQHLLDFYNTDSLEFDFRGNHVVLIRTDDGIEGDIIDPNLKMDNLSLNENDLQSSVEELNAAIKHNTQCLTNYTNNLVEIANQMAPKYQAINSSTPIAQENKALLNNIMQNPNISDSNKEMLQASLKKSDKEFAQSQAQRNNVSQEKFDELVDRAKNKGPEAPTASDTKQRFDFQTSIRASMDEIKATLRERKINSLLQEQQNNPLDKIATQERINAVNDEVDNTTILPSKMLKANKVNVSERIMLSKEQSKKAGAVYKKYDKEIVDIKQISDNVENRLRESQVGKSSIENQRST